MKRLQCGACGEPYMPYKAHYCGPRSGGVIPDEPLSAPEYFPPEPFAPDHIPAERVVTIGVDWARDASPLVSAHSADLDQLAAKAVVERRRMQNQTPDEIKQWAAQLASSMVQDGEAESPKHRTLTNPHTDRRLVIGPRYCYPAGL